MVQTFEDGAGFGRWVKAFPQGYVANFHVDPYPDTVIIHHAWCPKAAKMPPSARGNHIKYVKVCSKDKAELIEWAGRQVRGGVRPCPLCKP